jgi:hypothetical protein
MWRQSKIKKPYVSVIFANRNDGYGSRQLERFKKFIEYYSFFTKDYPDIFEFLIVDWNPPADSLPLRNVVNWKNLKQVRHFVVTSERHYQFAGNSKRKIYDYVARNVGLRRAKGEWSMIINQDIFLSPRIIEFIGKRLLDKKGFYRADRVDFNFDKTVDLPLDRFVDSLTKNASVLYRRQSSLWDPSTYKIDKVNQKDWPVSSLQPGESKKNNGFIIDGSGLRKLFIVDQITNKLYFIKADPDPCSGSNERKSTLYLRYKLHLNASGDFILAPTESFHKIHGCPESLDFYLHTDSYIVINLMVSGLKQMIFSDGNFAFHADHERHNHSQNETLTWENHELMFSEICRKGVAKDFSGQEWGLGNEFLEIIEDH